jgi:hypothetical protein
VGDRRHCYRRNVFSSTFGFPHILVVVIYLSLFALLFFALYLVVRAGVRRALRDHQLWLDSRGDGTGT